MQFNQYLLDIIYVWLSVVFLRYLSMCFSLSLSLSVAISLSLSFSLYLCFVIAVQSSFSGGSVVKNLKYRRHSQEDPLEEGLATRSCILARRIPWTEEPGGLQFMGSQRVGHDWSNWACNSKRRSPSLFPLWAGRESQFTLPLGLRDKGGG